jgi:hypothetical protein
MSHVLRSSLAALLLLAACGGSSTPPTTPSTDSAAAASSAAPPAGDKASDKATGDKDKDKKSDDKKADDKTASDKAGGDKSAATTPESGRLEDAQMKKTKSAGGHYALSVVSAAGMPADDVVRTLGSGTGKTDECYGKLFKKQLNANGKTTFDVEIDAKGKTKSVKVRGDDLKDADLVKCLTGIIKGAEWPKPADKAGAKTTFEWAVAGN